MILPKTHYERAVEYLSSVNYFQPVMERALKECGTDGTYEQLWKVLAPQRDISEESRKQFVYEINVFYHLYHMHCSGEKIFYITRDLASRLAKTSTNVDSYFLKNPYREIYVMVDPGLFKIADQDGSLFPVQGFYVGLRETGDAKELRIMAVSVLEPTKKIPFNDQTFYFRVLLGPGKIEDQVKSYIEESIVKKEQELKEYGGRVNIDYLEEFTFFVMNTLLYITSRKPDLIIHNPGNMQDRISNMKSNRKIQKLLRRSERTTSKVIIIAGSSVRDVDTEEIHQNGVGLWKLKNRVKVSGHWRNQWYGSELDQSRHQELIWITDYEKGPEMADLVNKPYIVKEPV